MTPEAGRGPSLMSRTEKALYQQIHPAKLATDFGTAFVAAALLWRHQLLLAMLVGFLPSIAVTLGLMRFGALDRLRDSPFGRYVARYMTRAVEALRFAGVALFWAGAWQHRPLLMALGFLTILLGWARGLLWPLSGEELAWKHEALERAVAEFRRTHGAQPMGAHLLRLEPAEAIVRVMYMTDHVPPDRAWYAVSRPGPTVRELPFEAVASLESPWR
jgi:hypothetical protein